MLGVACPFDEGEAVKSGKAGITVIRQALFQAAGSLKLVHY